MGPWALERAIQVDPAPARLGSQCFASRLQLHGFESAGLLGLGLGEHRLSQQAQELAEARSAARGGTQLRGLNSAASDCLAAWLHLAGAAAVSMHEMCETLGLLRIMGRRSNAKQ